jgi:hypothetical protein
MSTPTSSPDAARLRPGTLGKLALAAAILGFELVVLVLALRPDVSQAYRLHYIERSSCWLRPSLRHDMLASLASDPVNPGRLSPDAACLLLPGGWSHPEGWGIWTVARRAHVLVPVTAATGHVVLTLTAPSYLKQPQGLTIRHAGRLLFRGTVSPGGVVRVTLPVQPGDADEDGLMRLDLLVADPLSPQAAGAGPDTRRLGVGLLAVTRSTS